MTSARLLITQRMNSKLQLTEEEFVSLPVTEEIVRCRVPDYSAFLSRPKESDINDLRVIKDAQCTQHGRPTGNGLRVGCGVTATKMLDANLDELDVEAWRG